MSGTRVVFGSPAPAPIVDPGDALLNAGTLWLFDPAHPLMPAPLTTVPAHLGTVRNLARTQGQAITGNADPANLDFVFDIATAFTATDATKRGAFEVTPKHGLHGVASQASALDQFDGAHLRPGLPARDWWATYDKTKRVGVSLWLQNTRLNATAGGSTTQPEIMSVGCITNVSNMTSLYRSGVGYVFNNLVSQQVVNDQSLTGPTQATAVTKATGIPASGARVCWGAGASSALFNTINRALVATFNNKWPSFVLYRWSLVLLDEVGMAPTDFINADSAALAFAFNPSVDAASGRGRYYSDTWTAPATLCA